MRVKETPAKKLKNNEKLKKLKEIVGNELYEKIYEKFVGRRLYIPKIKETNYREKYHKYFEKGCPFKEIAEINKVTVGWVRKVFKAWKENDMNNIINSQK